MAVKVDFITTNFNVDLVTKFPHLLFTDIHNYYFIFRSFFHGTSNVKLKIEKKICLHVSLIEHYDLKYRVDEQIKVFLTAALLAGQLHPPAVLPPWREPPLPIL
jgi:hypothetical protein